MACSPRPIVSSIAATSVGDRNRPRGGACSRMSIASTAGSCAPPCRAVSVRRWYRPASTLLRVSRLGVADTNTAGAPLSRARTTAMSRAWYVTPSSCLNAVSCSSSTTIRPKSGNGRNRAERAPTTMGAVPSATARQVCRRVRDDRSECQTAGAAWNRAVQRSSHCAPNAISGSSTRAWRPDATQAATASRYTSVLPDPVTPSSRVTPKPAVTASRKAWAALACSGRSVGPGLVTSGVGGCQAGRATRSICPAWTMPRTMAGDTPAARVRAGRV